MIKKFFKVFSGFLIIIFFLLILVILAFNLSPRPGAFVINKLFTKSDLRITNQKEYNKSRLKVSVKHDLTYESKKSRNIFDLYMPKKLNGPLPVLIWVHGGGYVGGDKQDITEFATKISADSGIIVVCFNYAFAPREQYPSQLEQMDDLVKYLLANKNQYPNINFEKIFLGGDSAGAQISGQYAAIQTNLNYAKDMRMAPILSSKNLKGYLSYSGPVNLEEQARKKSDSFLLNFFTKTVAWSLLGTPNWQTDFRIKQVSIVPYVTKKFPPSYITDGNTLSFEEQGLTLRDRLKKESVPVDYLFFTGSNKKLGHEYQFNYNTKEAQEAYKQTLHFIDKNK